MPTLAQLIAQFVTATSCCYVSLQEAMNYTMRGVLQLAKEATKDSLPNKKISVLGLNASVLSAVPTKLTMLTLSNDNADESYAKFYDQITVPDPAIDVPKWSLIIPGRVEGSGSNIPLPPKGIKFNTGLAILFTTGIADTDSAGVAANDVVMNYALET